MLRPYAQQPETDKEQRYFPMSDYEPTVRQVVCSPRTADHACSQPCSAEQEEPIARDPSWLTAAEAFMAALGARDNETNGHAERVVSFSLRLGREVGLSPRDMIALELGARLHDVGKIGVPDSVLHKPAELDTEEWQKMRQHPARGEQMVRKLKLPDGAALIVGQHHEQWDGTGYPNRLVGEEISLPARVFSVIDAFDAITSDRVYRAGAPYEEALRRITVASGTQFDPQVVTAFTRIDSAEWQRMRIDCAHESEEQLTQTLS